MQISIITISIISYIGIHYLSHKLIHKYFDRIKVLASPSINIISIHPFKAKTHHYSILTSVGTTVFAIFLIQILPILFKIIKDLASDFNVSVVFSDSYLNSGVLDSFDRFSALIAQAAELLQQIAPLIAIFIGGYNLLSNLSRGMAAIQIK
jgi:hypothetical protein